MKPRDGWWTQICQLEDMVRQTPDNSLLSASRRTKAFAAPCNVDWQNFVRAGTLRVARPTLQGRGRTPMCAVSVCPVVQVWRLFSLAEFWPPTVDPLTFAQSPHKLCVQCSGSAGRDAGVAAAGLADRSQDGLPVSSAASPRTGWAGGQSAVVSVGWVPGRGVGLPGRRGRRAAATAT